MLTVFVLFQSQVGTKPVRLSSAPSAKPGREQMIHRDHEVLTWLPSALENRIALNSSSIHTHYNNANGTTSAL